MFADLFRMMYALFVSLIVHEIGHFVVFWSNNAHPKLVIKKGKIMMYYDKNIPSFVKKDAIIMGISSGAILYLLFVTVIFKLPILFVAIGSGLYIIGCRRDIEKWKELKGR